MHLHNGFKDRVDGGRQLADALLASGADALVDPIVLGVPRGGIPVAVEVAAGLRAPLEVLVARKVGAPGHVEFGIGAIAEGGVRVADPSTLRILRMSDQEFRSLADAEETELERRVLAYRSGRAIPSALGRDVVVVDDGLATGVTAEAALLAAARLGGNRVVLAVPVCPPDTARRLEAVADQVVCVLRPADLVAVGRWYETFDQITDDEVVALLAEARARQSVAPR